MSVLHSPAQGAWNLPRLLKGIWDGAPVLPVSGLSLDSRQLERGSLFLALCGADHDGRQFLTQALDAGAVAALVEDALPIDAPPALPVHAVPGLRHRIGDIASRFYGHPSRSLHIAAATGTNGKTTVSQILAQLIRAAGYDCGVIGTLGSGLDDRPRDAVNTTPDALALHATLAGWVAAAVPFVSMEASSHALHQGRVGAVEVDTAIFTNLTREHLDYHGDMQAYGEAKLALFQQPGLRTAVLNAHDPFSRVIARSLPEGVTCLYYGLEGHSLDEQVPVDLRLSALQLDAQGFSARLHSPWGRASLRCPLLGRFNAENLAAALAAALTGGLPLEAMVEAARLLVPVPGRMQPLRQDGAPLVVIDYAHTPDALAQVIAALRPQTVGRLIVVFGCGGDRDRGKRAEMARAVSAAADAAVITSDNPRTEDPMQIIADVEAGMSGEFQCQADRATAIAGSIAAAEAADTVLIAGKGHEDYQLMGGQRLPFSDVDEAQRALEAYVA